MAGETLGDIEIFRDGTHTDSSGRTISFHASDVARIAAGYDAARHPAPIVVGHPKHNDPAFGWIRGLRMRADGILVASAEKVAPEFAEAVAAGRYRKVSASFYLPDAPANPKPGAYYLRHVGFLGAAAPAVKGLAPVDLGEGDGGTVTLEFNEPGIGGALRRVLGGLRDLLVERFGADAVNAAIPTEALAEIRDTDPVAPAFAEQKKGEAGDGTGPAARSEIGRLTDAGMSLVAISEALGRIGEDASRAPSILAAIRDSEIKNPPDSLIEALRSIKPPKQTTDNTETGNTEERTLSKEESERLAALETENAALKARAAEFAEREKAAREAENKGFVSELVKAGRLAPGIAGEVAAFMGQLDHESTVEFSEERKQSPLAFFRDLLGKAGQVIDLSEHSADATGAPDTADPEAIAAKASEYREAERQKGRDVSVSAAVAHIMKGKS